MTTFLKIESHRARDKFKRLNLPHQDWCSFSLGHFTEIPSELLPRIAKIKGIRVLKTHPDPNFEKLMEPWK